MTEYVMYQDMTLKEIGKTFDKSPAAVGMAVKRMVERNPDENWKYKDGKSVKIKAEGVHWLAQNYFITPFDISISDPEKIKLEVENAHLKEVIELMKVHYKETLELELEKQALKFDSERVLAIEHTNTLEKEKNSLKIDLEGSQNDVKAKEDEIFLLKKQLESKDKEINELKSRGLFARLFNKKR